MWGTVSAGLLIPTLAAKAAAKVGHQTTLSSGVILSDDAQKYRASESKDFYC